MAAPLSAEACQPSTTPFLDPGAAVTSPGAPGTDAPFPPSRACWAWAHVSTTSVGVGPQAPTMMAAKEGPYDEPVEDSPAPMYCWGCPQVAKVPKMAFLWPQHPADDDGVHDPLGEPGPSSYIQ